MSDGPPAYILAGGRSRRFGSDKALASRDGEAGIVRLASRLRELGCRSVTAVADAAGRYDRFGVRTVGDLRPDAGPVGGLRTVLAEAGASGTGGLLVVPCDAWSLPDDLLPRLCGAFGGEVAFVCSGGEGFRPLPALIGPRLAAVIDRLRTADGGEPSLRLMVESAGDAAVRLPGPPLDVPTFNTPAERAALAGEPA